MALYDPVPAAQLSLCAQSLERHRANPLPAAQALDLSTEQVLNIVTLAEYLRRLPADYREFDMRDFVRSDGSHHLSRTPKPAEVPYCGTVACAAGHGPRAGVAPLPGEDWPAYCYRAFSGEGSMHLQYAMFGGGWVTVDNTPRGAAARMAFCLDHPELLEELTFATNTAVYADYVA